VQPQDQGAVTATPVPEPALDWRQLVEAMPQLVWVADADGRVVFYNGRVDDYSGPMRDQDGTWQWRPLVHVDDSDRTTAAWQAAVESDAPYACEHRIRMADGSYRWHVSRAVPLREPDGSTTWFGTATDIHDRALAEERARRSERRLAGVIDGLFNFVGVCSVDGTLLEINEPALTVGGVPREEVIGLPLWETWWWSHDPEVQDRLRRAIEDAAAGTPSRWDVEVRIAEGALLPIDFQLVPLVEDGVVTALIPSASDISDRVLERTRLEALAELSHRLNGSTTPSEVTDAICNLAPRVLGAGFVHPALLDDQRTCFRVAMGPIDADVARRWATIPLTDDPTPLGDVVRTGETIFLDDAARAERYPDTMDDAARLGLAVSATLPLRTESGEVLGALWCGWHEHTDFTVDLQARLQLLADLCSQALERARRADVHDRLVHELQGRLLFGHEPVSVLDVSVGYEPAQSDIGFGGDWYDVVRVDGDVTALVVGDVAGHGIAAAAEMATTKASVRATILSAGCRAGVLPLASRALGHLGSGYVATVAVAWIDTEAGTLDWSLAGHPPPVVRTPDGRTRLLEGAHHPPLGMPSDARGTGTEPFPPGSMLVLYTDGLVERPGDDLDESLEGLRALVEGLPGGTSAEDARDRLMRALASEHARDDVAIVVAVRPS